MQAHVERKTGMDENTRISVIIPVYNAEKYLRRCIDSVLAQTVQDFELILVNDGSTDKSELICNFYAKENQKIRVIFQENKGPSAARNTGIRNARGKYLVFVDADDWVENNYLEVLLEYMTEGGVSACRIEKQLRGQEKIIEYTKEEAQCSVLSVFGMRGVSVCKLYDAALIKKLEIYYDESVSICEDTLFIIHYLSKTYGKIYYLPFAPYHYIKTKEGITNSRYNKSYKFHMRALSEYEAIRRCEDYIEGDRALYYQKMWSVKGAVNTLRTMVANNYRDKKQYRGLRWLICKNSIRYIGWEGGNISTKISVMLSCISPKLELFIWKIMYAKRN